MLLFLLRSFSAGMACLPLGIALALGRGLGRLFSIVVPRQRRRAMTHLARCFPEKSEEERRGICRRMFTNLGMNIVELFRWMGGKEVELKLRITAEHEDRMLETLARGKGAIGLVAHIGNFDVMGLWGASRFPLTIISKELKGAAAVNKFWMEKRAQAGLKIVPAHNSYRACLGVLKRSECLGFILDQNMSRDDGIFVNFFGQLACTTPGLAVMSAHSGAPVLPVFMVRGADGFHTVHFLPAIAPPSDRKPETIARATQEYTKVIEDIVRAYPDQWIWMHRRWRTQPKPAQAS